MADAPHDQDHEPELTRADIMTKLRPDGKPYTNRKAAETACVADGDALKALEYLLNVLGGTCKCGSGDESGATSTRTTTTPACAAQPQGP